MRVSSLLLLLGCSVLLAAEPPFPDKPKPPVRQLDRWEKPLEDALTGADRLVVQPVKVKDPVKQPPFEIKGADKIKTLFPLMEVDAAKSNYHCLCDGDYRFQFYQGDKLLVTLGFHHGFGLRWHGGQWPGDAYLTLKAQPAIPLWFKENGYEALQKDREARLADLKEEQAATEKFIECFHEATRKFFRAPGARGPQDIDKVDGDLGKNIAQAIGKGDELAQSVCKALGTLKAYDQSWSQTTGKERRALAAVNTVTGEEFLAALDKLKDDRKALLGAARVYFWERHIDKIPEKSRPEWTVRLCEVVLTDGLDSNKSIALRALAEFKDPQVQGFLREVCQGKVGKEIEYAGGGSQEPGIRTSAALILAQQGDATIKEAVEQRLKQAKARQEVAGLEVCLALLGDAKYVKQEHFKVASYSIGYAALKAIELHKDKPGVMDLLVEGGLEHPWGGVNNEAVYLFERITGQDWTQKYPNVMPYSFRKDIKEWWQANGKEFTKKRQK